MKTITNLALAAALLAGTAGAVIAQEGNMPTGTVTEHAAKAAEHSEKAAEHSMKAQEHAKKAHEHAKHAHKKAEKAEKKAR
ncbi:MAG: hypothetical protein EBQ80_04700 [Proteobacteria bacterium]|nr:hypothetical protein [Pseudomonadota bacterium]